MKEQEKLGRHLDRLAAGRKDAPQASQKAQEGAFLPQDIERHSNATKSPAEPALDALGGNPTASGREQTKAWDIEAIGRSLTTTPENTHDIAFGEGVLLRLGDAGGRKNLELYPTESFARLTASNAQVDLYRVDPPRVSQDGVILETSRHGENVTLSLTAQGEVALFIAQGDSREAGETAAPEGSGKKPEPQQEVEMPAQATERERFTLLGRVGAIPYFRTTPKGILVARFPLAVHEEDNKTSWHTILAFGERAKKLQETLQKGQQVEVIGYLHERQQATKDGKTKLIQEVYAVVVKIR